MELIAMKMRIKKSNNLKKEMKKTKHIPILRMFIGPEVTTVSGSSTKTGLYSFVFLNKIDL